MSLRKLAAAAVLGFVSTTPGLALAAPEDECILGNYEVTSVFAYKPETHIGKTTIRPTRGAIVHVQAAPGLTAEWLRLQISRHLATMRDDEADDCPLDVEDIEVTVKPAGTGYDVTIVPEDPDDADEVLRLARLLV